MHIQKMSTALLGQHALAKKTIQGFCKISNGVLQMLNTEVRFSNYLLL